jgi:hypothetical protein
MFKVKKIKRPYRGLGYLSILDLTFHVRGVHQASFVKWIPSLKNPIIFLPL